MLTLGILCSGRLGLNTLSKIAKEYAIEFILTDSNSFGIIDFATNNHIPFFTGNPRKGNGYSFVRNFSVDVIASINYLFLIEKDIIEHSNSLTFNIHGSLLPKYRGRTPHVWAIINGETKAGITAHIIDSGCDTGQIIHQLEMPIETEDTGATMLDKYANAYYPLVKKVLYNLVHNQLNLIVQNEKHATYFGKRTAEDGEINWQWTKESIRNWVRAQANPYPGAFTFYKNQKVIIDKVSFSNERTTKNQVNGEIIKIEPKVTVKTQNGSVSLDVIRTENCTFVIGNKFCNENRK
tara:strand:+ start:35779 stop:36660 length:882 start_codon:yes stop_codon:yes gene_type:complete